MFLYYRRRWKNSRILVTSLTDVQKEEISMSESHLNEYGVEVSTRRIFSWDEFEMFHWDDDGLSGQIVTGERMHLIRAT